MIINSGNNAIGYKAMASVLMLYYQLLNEGGFTNEQTVYVHPDDFNGYDYLDVVVQEDEGLDIDEELLRQGAIVYLLADLNDILREYYDSYHRHSIATKIIEVLKAHKFSPIPEVETLLKIVSVSENEVDYSKYDATLDAIYRRYVHGYFIDLLDYTKQL